MSIAMSRSLTEKQRRFVEAYMGKAAGNATEAARIAGYAGSRSTHQNIGSENLLKPIIQRALAKKVSQDPLVADRKARQEFWTQVMFDGETAMRDRLRASELLGKTQADFIDRVEHSGEMTQNVKSKVDLSVFSKDELKSFKSLLDKAKQ